MHQFIDLGRQEFQQFWKKGNRFRNHFCWPCATQKNQRLLTITLDLSDDCVCMQMFSFLWPSSRQMIIDDFDGFLSHNILSVTFPGRKKSNTK